MTRVEYEIVGTHSPCVRLWGETMSAAVADYRKAFHLERGVVLARPLANHEGAEMFEVTRERGVRPLRPGAVVK